MEETLTMQPSDDFRRCGIAALDAKYAPLTLIRSMSSHMDSERPSRSVCGTK